MSGIAVIWNRDGRPVDPEVLTRMLRLLAHRGRDGAHHWVRGPVAFGHVALDTTAENPAELQPLSDDSSGTCITFDGRIDNREELVSLLETEASSSGEVTDARLVLSSYRKWGDQCVAHLLGDFAFAIWDAPKRRLFCARDPLGVRPLFHASLGDTFICGSEIRSLFALPGLSKQADLAILAGRLMRKCVEFDDTLYKGVFRVPLAHSLTVSREATRLQRYWDIDPERQIHHRSDDEYAEHFRELLFDAVRCRLRATAPVAGMLSGGLDSSGIVCAAESIRAAGGITDPRFETFSMVFDRFTSGDERFIDAVLNRSTIKANRHVADRDLTVAAIARHQLYPGVIYSPQMMVLGAMLHEMRDAGFRVMLDGTGGDELAGNGFHHRMALVRRGQWRTLWPPVREYAAAYNISAVGLFLDLCLRPAVPEPIKAIYRRLRRRAPQSPFSTIVPEAMLRQTGVRERIANPAAAPAFRDPMKSDMYTAIFSGWAPTVLTENYELMVSLHGIEMRQPYRDRRLVEFALAVPPDQLWRKGWSRVVFRNAMKGIVPDQILQRRGKGVFTPQFDSVLAGSQAQQVKSMSENSVLVRLGVADAGVLRALVAQYQNCPEDGTSLVISDLIALELICREILGECEHTATVDNQESTKLQGESAALSITC